MNTSVVPSSAAPPPPPFLSSVEPERKKSFLVPLIVAVIIISTLVAVRMIYKRNQQKEFLASLIDRKSDVSKDDFQTVCKHKEDCVGRFIVWDGIVDGDAFPGSESFNVRSVNGGAKVYTVEPLSTRLHDGDEVIFHGFLREVNVMSPDIINTGSIRQVVATAAQLARDKQIAAVSPPAEVPSSSPGIALTCSDPRDTNDVRYFYYGDRTHEFFRFESDGSISERISLALNDTSENAYTYSCSNLDPNLADIGKCDSFTLRRDTLDLVNDQKLNPALAKESGSDSYDRFACHLLDKDEAVQILTKRDQAIQNKKTKEDQSRADQLSKDKL